MKSARWIAIEALIALVSAFLGWLLPDGLSRFAALLGQPELVVAPSDRLLSALVVFLFVSSLQLIIASREGMRNVLETLPVSIEKKLDSSILQLFIDDIAKYPTGVMSLQRIMEAAVSPLAHGTADMLDARSVVIERALTNAAKDITLLGGSGLEIDIYDNNEITLRLAANCDSYRQIQRRVYRVPGEWTQTWMRFVTELGARGVSCQYVVLADREILSKERDRLDSMNRYLTDNKWDFYFCDLRDVLDSFGGVLPTEANLEIFDRAIVKIQETSATSYQGGVRLRVAICSLDERAELRRLNAAVSQHLTRYSADLFRSA